MLQAINSTMTKKVLPTFQSSFLTKETGLTEKVDIQSSGLHRSQEVENCRKTQENLPKVNSCHSNRGCYGRESSVDGQVSDLGYDTKFCFSIRMELFSPPKPKNWTELAR